MQKTDSALVIPGKHAAHSPIARSRYSSKGQLGGEESINTRIYKSIKQAIFANRLRPGSKLTHQELATLFEVSRTPVREALERLYQEGYVDHRRHRGFFVAEIDEAEAREILELREALELSALQLAIRKGAKIDISALEDTNRRYRAAVEDGTTKARMLIDQEFHVRLAAYSGNRQLVNALDATFERLILKMRVDGYRVLRGKEAYREHISILKALQEHDFRRLKSALTSHLLATSRRLLEQIGTMSGSSDG